MVFIFVNYWHFSMTCICKSETIYSIKICINPYNKWTVGIKWFNIIMFLLKLILWQLQSDIYDSDWMYWWFGFSICSINCWSKDTFARSGSFFDEHVWIFMLSSFLNPWKIGSMMANYLQFLQKNIFWKIDISFLISDENKKFN